jgi:hypothetical protein
MFEPIGTALGMKMRLKNLGKTRLRWFYSVFASLTSKRLEKRTPPP